MKRTEILSGLEVLMNRKNLGTANAAVVTAAYEYITKRKLRKKGEWVETDMDMYQCSICGYDDSVGKTKYCPNCGSFMENYKTR